MLCEWWRSYDWPPVELDHLPTGYIVESGGIPICAGFTYYTGTAFGIFEFVIARKDCEPTVRAAALDVLISSVKLFMKHAGVRSIFTSIKHEGLIGRLTKSHGFVKADEGMTNFIGRT
jgi:hypothetical protein